MIYKTSTIKKYYKFINLNHIIYYNKYLIMNNISKLFYKVIQARGNDDNKFTAVD